MPDVPSQHSLEDAEGCDLSIVFHCGYRVTFKSTRIGSAEVEAERSEGPNITPLRPPDVRRETQKKGRPKAPRVESCNCFTDPCQSALPSRWPREQQP